MTRLVVSARQKSLSVDRTRTKISASSWMEVDRIGKCALFKFLMTHTHTSCSMRDSLFFSCFFRVEIDRIGKSPQDFHDTTIHFRHSPPSPMRRRPVAPDEKPGMAFFGGGFWSCSFVLLFRARGWLNREIWARNLVTRRKNLRTFQETFFAVVQRCFWGIGQVGVFSTTFCALV